MLRIATVVLTSMLLCNTAVAETRWIWGIKVWEASMDTSRFGQCFIRVYPSTDIQATLPSCKAEYIMFDCGAELEGSTKSTNKTKFDMAMVAQLTQQRTSFLVNDQKTINGYCFAEQVRLLK